MKTNFRLFTRGDDIGSSISSNEAAIEAARDGMLRNISMMACTPYIEQAAGAFAGMKHVSIGMHIALNCEWSAPLWGPVLPASKVPSLVKDDGTFLVTPMDNHARGFVLSEAMAEVEAQLARLRSLGLKVDYLDDHMGVTWLAGFDNAIKELCRRDGLVDARAVTGLSDSGLPRTGDLSRDFVSWVKASPDGDFQLVCHPAKDTPELRAFTLVGEEPGTVAAERNAEYVALCDPSLRKGLAALGIEPCAFRVLA